MVKAAEKLLMERGNDDFTLTEVSKLGKVSIGSIYCRFDSKDELIRAVQTTAMQAVVSKHIELVERARAAGPTLDDVAPALIEEVAEVLKEHAPMMRPMMARAPSDPVIAAAGKAAFYDLQSRACAALLEHRDEIRRPDPEKAVESCFRIAHAAIARYLGFGSSPDTAGEGSWEELKADLGVMSAAFLKAPA